MKRMNRTNNNRIYLIIIVVTSLTIGFITGFIAGRHSDRPVPSPAGSVTPSKGQAVTGSPQNQLVSSGTGISSTQNRSQNRFPSEERIDTVGSKESEPPSASVSGSTPRKDRPEDSRQPEKNHADSQKTITTDTRSNEKGKEQDEKGVYTVQVGAFRDKKEAEALKTKLEKKGYNVYMVKEKERNKKGSLYKVRIGEFETRREAEITAIKINKAEGLHAFAVKK